MKTTYLKTHIKSVISVSKIVTIHHYEVDRNFVFTGERHDFWEMVYVDKGRVEIIRDGERQILQQGQIVFHAPNEFHAIRAMDSAPNFFVISFETHSAAMVFFEKYQTSIDKTLKGLMSAIIMEAEEAFYIAKNNPHLHQLKRKPQALLGSEQMIKSYLEQFFIYLIRTSPGNRKIFPSKESMEDHLISSVKAYMQAHLYERVSVGDICDQFGYSKSYLSKSFREQTGKTLMEYTAGIKIDRAKELIREENMNFSQISDRLSFESPQYFSSVFKRVTGMTPSEFKQSLEIK